MKTPKQIAIQILRFDSDCLFDYYYERDHEDYNKASETKQREIGKQIRKFELRFLKMLDKAKRQK